MSSSSSQAGKKSFIDFLLEFSIPLQLGVVVALVWANLDHHGYEAAVHWSPFGHHSPLNLHFFANEILMVFFFGVAAKEITEAALPGGALNPPRKAVNPLMGTAGGIFGPVGAYLLAAYFFDAPEIYHGWGIPTATDIALAWLVARVVFGAKHPAVSFLLLLAVADDAAGLAIIAIFYPDPTNPTDPKWLALVALAMLIAYGMRRRGVWSFWPYLLGPGLISWMGLHSAHLHPSLALVAVVPFMPSRGMDLGMFQERTLPFQFEDTLSQFEHFFKRPVDFGLFAFSLANAGVEFSSIGAATWSVLIALLVGKTIGISVMSGAAHAAGFPLPEGMSFTDLILSGVIAGIGLTVALFVAGVAFTDPALQGAAKMGALLSTIAAPVAILLGKVFTVDRVETDPNEAAAIESARASTATARAAAQETWDSWGGGG